MPLIDFILHVDRYVTTLAQTIGSSTYLVFFLIVFCETGLVVMPFLPGDSLLFAGGSLAAAKSLSIGWVFLSFWLAAMLGDSVNYWIGRFIGLKVFETKRVWVKREYYDRAHAYYLAKGPKTILLARFIPIVRTFSPFVAGVAVMPYSTFLKWSIFGSLVWTSLFTFAGYFFGHFPPIQSHFGLVVIAIILVSLIPLLVEIWKAKWGKQG